MLDEFDLLNDGGDLPDLNMSSHDDLSQMDPPSQNPTSSSTPHESTLPPSYDEVSIKSEPNIPSNNTTDDYIDPSVDSQDNIKEEDTKESDPAQDTQPGPFFTPEVIEMYRHREKMSFQLQKMSLENINKMMLERRKWADVVGKHFHEFKQIVQNVMQTREKMIQAKRPGHERVGFTVVRPENRKKVRKSRDFY
jgi:hypothetical protein